MIVENKFKNKGLHLMHLNIRSLFCKNKFDMFKQQMTDSGIDIIGLSETWLKKGIHSNYVNIHGYNLLRSDRNWSENGQLKKGGGVCLYVNEDMIFSENELSNLNKSSVDIEIQWISIRKQNNRILYVANLYRPPQGSIKEFNDYLRNCLNSLSNVSKKDIFIMGDFNIDVKKKSNQHTKDLIQMLNSYGMKQHIEGTTRYGRTNSCIDLIFTNSEYVMDAGILDLNFSDHQAVFITRKKAKNSKNKIEFMGRSYKNYDITKFHEALSDFDWDDFYNIEDPNEGWDLLYERILDVLDNMCPEKTFKVNCYREDWMNKDIMEKIIDKDKALKKAKKSNNALEMDLAKRLRNETGKLVENARKQHFQEEYENSKGDPKRYWRNIYDIIPKNRNNKGKIHLKNGDGNEINSDNTASYINDFFTDIGPNLASKFNEKWKYFGIENENSINDIEIIEGYVYDFVKDINICKSSGFKEISSQCLRDALLALIPQLCYIFNQSIKTCKFPDKWKVATIVPIFKGGNKEDVSNYRPVSLLPVTGKIFEKLIHYQIVNYLDNNEFLSNKQNGFRKGRSTLDSIVNFTSDIFENINDSKFTIATFIDLKKAFDTVNHKILLEKLLLAGINGNTLNLISNYLENRFQKTICNGKLSELNKVTCGVPQGSILGPLFFLIYINDLQGILGNNSYHLYADDTVIYFSDKSVEIAEMKLQSILDKFSKWCAVNALTVNTSKTKVMVFGSRHRIKNCKKPNLFINNEQLQMVPTYKYLGINLDQTLNFKYHLDSLINNITFKLYLFSKIRRYLNEKCAITVYKTMLMPFYDYCDIIYMFSCSSELQKLDRHHKRGMKISVNNSHLLNDVELHLKCNLSELDLRRRVHLRNYMFKIKDIETNLVVKNDNNNINTRLHDGPVFNVTHPNSEPIKRSVMYAGAIDWNNLDADIRNIDDIVKFKRNQKMWMLNSFKD